MFVRSIRYLFILTLFLSTNAFMLKNSVKLYSKQILKMAGGQVPYVPYYPDKNKKYYQWMDIYNALGRDRTLFVGRYLDDEFCNQLIASLIWLQGQDKGAPITLYFNVPGGNMKPGLAVFDVMRRMTCPLITINAGLTVGLGALLCAVGTSGQRYALPNARFLMAKTGLEDGLYGQAVDLAVGVREVVRDNEKVITEMAKLTAQPRDKLAEDLKRDFYLTAPEAAAYGLIDKVLVPDHPVKMMRFRGNDEEKINFGHFSEAKKVKESDEEVTVPYKADDEKFDDFAASELEKQKQKPVRARDKGRGGGGGMSTMERKRAEAKKLAAEKKKKLMEKNKNKRNLNL